MADRISYDVAISLLDADRGLAEALSDRLKDRMRVFVYSERQKELAGNDGVAKFSAVFGSESRLVVIIYRDGWGKTKWSGVEQEAIRQRYFNSGSWDFLLVVPVEKDAKAPEWLPATKIWLSYASFGLDGLIPVIDQRVRDLGGEARVETAVDRAARLARQRERERERSAILGSQRGVDMARKELATLFEMIEDRAAEVTKADPSLDLRAQRKPTDRDVFGLAGNRGSVTLGWSQQWANSLDGSSLYFVGYPRRFLFDGYTRRDRETVFEEHVEFTTDDAGEPAWVIGKGRTKTLSTSQLVDYVLNRLLDVANSPPRTSSGGAIVAL